MGKKIIQLIFLLCFAYTACAQFTDFGQDPASVRWKQINTKDFQIIYPDYFENNAQKIANIYAALYRHANTLAHKPVKVSMIVHPNGGVSNGSVAWAPKRSDLYTMPQQDPSDEWLEHLCIHEFRHIVQIDKINQGLTRILYYLFGEQAPIAITGMYLPSWFMEGDAVAFESAVGHLGRGRSPEFLNQMKAQVVEKGIYSYFKAALGSYKDYVPNKYIFGYYMVANSRANYGPEIWQNALNRIGRHPYSLSPFATSLKHTLRAHRNVIWQDSSFRSLFINPDSVKKANTYYDSKRTLYHDNFSELQQIWKKEADLVKNRFDTISTFNSSYAGYYYPIPYKQGIIAFKKGLQQTGAFVFIDSLLREKILTRTGSLEDMRFTIYNDNIVWTEYRPHPRWEHGGRITLTTYNLHTKKYRYYSNDNNRFAPFQAGSYLGLVETDKNNRAYLVLLDQDLQKEVRRIAANPYELFIHPSYHNGKITTVVQTFAGLHLESINLNTGKRNPLTKSLWYELDNPLRQDSLLLFRASFNGNNALYIQNLHTGQTHNVLNSPFGIRFPAFSPDRESIFFSFYTSDGYKPGKVALKDLCYTPLKMNRFPLADTLSRQEDWKLHFNSDSVFNSRPYNKFLHLMNVHSWGPLYVNAAEQEILPGIVVYSQNKLSTLSLSGGFIKDNDYDHGAWMLHADYKALWPIFNIDFKSGRYDHYNFRDGILNQTNGQMDSLYVDNRAHYTQASLAMQLPLNISRRNYIRSLTPYIRYKIGAMHHYSIRNVYQYTLRNNIAYLFPADRHNYTISTPANYYQMLEYGLIFNNQTRMTQQEINPRWGQILQAGYAHTPLKKLKRGHEWWVSGYFFFPGFCRNHSFYAYSGYQKRPDNEFYDKQILSPRGIHIKSAEFTTLRSGYRLPFLFPDQHITSLLYIKALKGGAFFDMAHEKIRQIGRNYYSYGIDCAADIQLLRLPFPVSVGFYSGYETRKRALFIDFNFNISFNI